MIYILFFKIYEVYGLFYRRFCVLLFVRRVCCFCVLFDLLFYAVFCDFMEAIVEFYLK